MDIQSVSTNYIVSACDDSMKNSYFFSQTRILFMYLLLFVIFACVHFVFHLILILKSAANQHYSL